MDLDDLYGLPLDRFIPERASLVRELRSDGDREEAAAVAALRKPSVAAWAVNQLIRTRRHDVEELFAAGDELRDVQAGVLGGSADARDLRSAAERERVAVDALVEIARGLLSSSGNELSATTVERVAETLHAGALDDDARGQVSEGRLVRELRHVGLGAGLGGAVAGPPATKRSPKSPGADGGDAGRTGGKGKAEKGKADTGAADTGTAERETTKERKAAERREREETRKQARALERDAAREVDRAERALRTALERETRAAEALRQAEAGARDAEAGVEAAAAAHRQAKQRLDDMTGWARTTRGRKPH